MDHPKDVDLHRTSSQNSYASSQSYKSGTMKAKSKKRPSPPSTVPTPSDRSLTSFPSLSPEPSPEPDPIKAPAKPFIPGVVGSRPQPESTLRPSTFASLTTTHFKGRSALFEDATAGARFVPGTLHHASDEHIQRLVDNNGAVAIVRQLSEDLAQRDAEISALRRRTDERERELKRMLREVEVSNLDIETRLRRLDEPCYDPKDYKSSSVSSKTHPSDWSNESMVNALMHEAMSDTVSSHHASDDDRSDRNQNLEFQATIKPSGVKLKDGVNFKSTPSRRTGGPKGWQDYLWGSPAYQRVRESSSVYSDPELDSEAAVRARIVSGEAGRRKALEENLFKPPQDDRISTISQEEKVTDSRSRGSSMSVSSWTVRLFAGNPSAGRNIDVKKPLRARNPASSREHLSKSVGDGPGKGPMTAAKASLLRLNRTASSTSLSRNRPSNPSARVPPGSRKPMSVQTRSRVSGNVPQVEPVAQKESEGDANLGPVEMDRILPHETRPPALSQSYYQYHPTDLLTDGFGFIYDQRRRNKQREAAEVVKKNRFAATNGNGESRDAGQRKATNSSESSNRPDTPTSYEEQLDDKPPKKWQDYLRIATFPTELLSHTPLAGPIMSLAEASPDNVQNASQMSVKKRQSLPSASSNPEPTASTVVAENPEFTHSSTPSMSELKNSDQEPVKLLLDQLTELHDSLQRERTIKWNEFLRKVRAERKKESALIANSDLKGKAKSMTAPEVSLVDGEIIGVSGLGNKGKVGRAKWNEFRHLVLGGIPVAYRAKVWSECSGAAMSRIPGYYEDLLHGDDDDSTVVAQIDMDIHRTLTDNVFFRRGPGVSKLKEILLAYSRRNKDVGYCQGMNLITASLLLIMPTAEDAFWLLTSIVEKILPPHYYDHSLLASRADQQVLRQYVAELLPRLSHHLDKLSIELEALTFQWFLSLFTDCLSAEALYRVWDVVFCTNDGSTFLFQVAVALLKLNEKSLLECDSAAAVYTYINHHMTSHAISIDSLIQASEALRKLIVRGELEHRRQRAVTNEKEIMKQREIARATRLEKFKKEHLGKSSSNHPDINRVNEQPGKRLERESGSRDPSTKEDELHARPMLARDGNIEA